MRRDPTNLRAAEQGASTPVERAASSAPRRGGRRSVGAATEERKAEGWAEGGRLEERSVVGSTFRFEPSAHLPLSAFFFRLNEEIATRRKLGESRPSAHHRP